MIQSKTRWHIGKPDYRTAEALANELKISRFVAELLTTRGISNVAEAASILGEGKRHDPMLLKGMKKAAERIQLALKRNEKILIYGDYDADGISSTSLMIMLFEQLHANFDYYIPHRFHEGYGLNNEAIDRAKASGTDLIVTVDNGISALDQIAYANKLGIDVIVTDHHEPPDQLPPAYAIINPKQPGCEYPFKALAGAGVAYKLAQVLLADQVPECYLELAALGTIADIMPLTDENRWIVQRGLRAMNESQLAGIRALLNVSNLTGKSINATQVGFALGPRINASGRMQHADLAVKLLISQDEAEALAYAEELDQLNKERQRIVQQMTEEAVEQWSSSGREQTDRIILLKDEHWHEGVIGIVASKLLEKYYCPAIVFSVNEETGLAKGSARSIPGFSMYEALQSCSHLLEQFGGHDAAAGLTVKVDNLPLLQQHLNTIANEVLKKEDLIPITNADMECRLDDIHMDTVEQLEQLAPYGQANPPPLFVVRGLQVAEKIPLGKEGKHLKLIVRDPASKQAEPKEALLFGNGLFTHLISSAAPIDLLVELGINEWNGRRTPQLFVRDLRIGNVQVLDWRKRNGWENYNKVLTYLQSFSPSSWSPLLLTAAELDAVNLPEPLQSSPVRTYQELELLQIESEDASWPVTDLFLLAPPPSLDVWQSIISKLKRIERIYILIGESMDQASPRLPTREAFKRLYAALRKRKQWERSDKQFLNQLAKYANLDSDTARFGIQVFKELNFVTESGEVEICVPEPAKRPLESSVLYQNKRNEDLMYRFWLFSSENELAQKLLPNQMMQVEQIKQMEETV